MVLDIALGPGTGRELYLSDFLISVAVSEGSAVPESS